MCLKITVYLFLTKNQNPAESNPHQTESDQNAPNHYDAGPNHTDPEHNESARIRPKRT